MDINRPYPVPSRFTEQLLCLNALSPEAFRAWAFAPGMGMGAAETWWGSCKARLIPHEGVDLCCYTAADGSLRLLPEGVWVPAIYDGVVVKLLPDYLGVSIFIEHPSQTGVCLTIFGHTVPHPALTVGQRLAAGEKFCAMAPRRASKTAPFAHLHLSLAWSAAPVDYAGLDWSNMAERVTLLDPAEVLGAPWQPLALESLQALH